MPSGVELKAQTLLGPFKCSLPIERGQLRVVLLKRGIGHIVTEGLFDEPLPLKFPKGRLFGGHTVMEGPDAQCGDHRIQDGTLEVALESDPEIRSSFGLKV